MVFVGLMFIYILRAVLEGTLVFSPLNSPRLLCDRAWMKEQCKKDPQNPHGELLLCSKSAGPTFLLFLLWVTAVSCCPSEKAEQLLRTGQTKSSLTPRNSWRGTAGGQLPNLNVEATQNRDL